VIAKQKTWWMHGWKMRQQLGISAKTKLCARFTMEPLDESIFSLLRPDSGIFSSVGFMVSWPKEYQCTLQQEKPLCFFFSVQGRGLELVQ
jgi:hypothetical protein